MDSQEVARLYENLRAGALGISDNQNHCRHGYALFVRRGMAEWLEVCRTFDSSAPAVAMRSKALHGGDKLPKIISEDLLAVVGEMVLACAEGNLQ